MSKRIVREDEGWNVFNDIWEVWQYDQKTIEERRDVWDTLWRYEPIVKKISQVNRKRRNYLLLRDWCKKRPWKQMYSFVDTREHPHLRRPIREFYGRIAELKRLERERGVREDDANPSLKSNVWACLFGVHPIASHEDEGYVLFRPKFFDAGCVICGEPFELSPTAPIVQLHVSGLGGAALLVKERR